MTSKNVLARAVYALTSFALAIGCGGPAPTPATDAGPLRLVDSGEVADEPDAFVEPDAGDGTCGESISLTGWAALPASCLPRCSRETAEAINACRSMPDPEGCTLAAVRADTTPSVRVQTGSGPLEVSCAGATGVYSCVLWQVFSCQSEICPAEYSTYVNCAYDTGTACTPEFEALDACASGSPEWTPCFQPRSSACYDLGT